MNNKGILYINIDGTEYKAEPTLGAMLLFKKETGKEVNEITGLSDTIIWLWCCVKSGSEKTGHPLQMNCQEFADSCTMDVLNAWTEAQKQSGEESKKKKTVKQNRKGSSKS